MAVDTAAALALSVERRLDVGVDQRGANSSPRHAGAFQIIARGLTLCCPNCGGRTLFVHWLKMHERCARCGLLFEREEGFFLGAMVFNYALTTLIAVVLVAVLLLSGAISTAIAVIAAIATSLALPLLFYPASKSLWLMTYYLFVPNDLPVNQSETRPC